jgi:hypothetical protein
LKNIGENSFSLKLRNGSHPFRLDFTWWRRSTLSKHFLLPANPILYLETLLYLLTAKTWNICPIALEEAIIDRMTKNKIKAIITVNLYGMPYKVDEVHAIAEKYGILF